MTEQDEAVRAALDNLLRHHNSGAWHGEQERLEGCEFARQASAALATPPPAAPHEHEWKREYAPGYRQASEANDWREEAPAKNTGLALKLERVAAGVSQGEIARELGCSRQLVAYWEAVYRPSPGAVVRYRQALERVASRGETDG